MAFQLTATAQYLSEQNEILPQIILEIEGVGLLFGTTPIFKEARWDDNNNEWDDENIYWDSGVVDERSKDYISLGGTTKNINQQLYADKGGTGSVSTMDIELVDINSEVAIAFSYNQINELLGKSASVYLTFQGASHPEDSIPVFRGFVDDYSIEQGSIVVSVSHSENLKRQKIFTEYQGVLTSAMSIPSTTAFTETALGFIPSRDAIRSYIQIDEEIMEVTAIGVNNFTVTRAQLGTSSAIHEIEAEIKSFYVLSGTPTDLALKLMLSDSDNEYREIDSEIKSIKTYFAEFDIQNVLIVNNYDIQEYYGLTAGDFIQISGSSSNDGTYTILLMGKTQDGDSFIQVGTPLTNEATTSGTLTYKSKYNTLSTGLGMKPSEVDVEGHEYVANTFASSFVDYSFYIKETIEGKSFIDQEILFPQGMYSIPRKARSSLKIVAPPLSIDDTPTLSIDNITNVERLKQVRATHAYLYNEIIYRYNEDTLTDKFLNAIITIDQDSKNRIKVGAKQMEIISKGLRRNSATKQTVERASSKLLERYKFAARSIDGVGVTYKEGFRLEIGDIILLGGENTKLVDPYTGLKEMPITSFEIVNKKLNVVNGKITIDLLETGFAVTGRFGVFSPSSYIKTGSTSSRLILGNLLFTGELLRERDKWKRYIGGQVRVRSESYLRDEVTYLKAFDNANLSAVILDPPLSFTPQNGDFMELPLYDQIDDSDVGQIYKIKYTFTMPQEAITSGVSQTVFNVASVADLFVGQLITVHNDSYSLSSPEVTITNISGLQVTVGTALGFTPANGYKIETLQFEDGEGYRFL